MALLLLPRDLLLELCRFLSPAPASATSAASSALQSISTLHRLPSRYPTHLALLPTTPVRAVAVWDAREHIHREGAKTISRQKPAQRDRRAQFRAFWRIG